MFTDNIDNSYNNKSGIAKPICVIGSGGVKRAAAPKIITTTYFLLSLRNFASGLFWISVLLCALMAIARSMTIERDEGALVGLNLSGVDPSGVFLGKACAIAIQLLVLEVFLGVGIILLYGSEVEDLWLLISTGLFACIAVSALGTIFGFLASGLGVRETLLPILLLPLLLPLLIGATRAFDDALGIAAVNGWNWFAFVAGLTVILTGVGVAANYLIVEN